MQLLSVWHQALLELINVVRQDRTVWRELAAECVRPQHSARIDIDVDTDRRAARRESRSAGNEKTVFVPADQFTREWLPARRADIHKRQRRTIRILRAVPHDGASHENEFRRVRIEGTSGKSVEPISSIGGLAHATVMDLTVSCHGRGAR